MALNPITLNPEPTDSGTCEFRIRRCRTLCVLVFEVCTLQALDVISVCVFLSCFGLPAHLVEELAFTLNP